MEEKLIKVKDVSSLLDLSRSSVYHLIKLRSNPIPYFRLNGAIRFNKDEVIEWIRSNR